MHVMKAFLKQRDSFNRQEFQSSETKKKKSKKVILATLIKLITLVMLITVIVNMFSPLSIIDHEGKKSNN